MRFKIRTLLIATALMAILIAFFAKPYLDSTAESRALARMEKDWELLLDSAAFLGDRKSPPRTFHWSQWPARKLFGDESLTRVQKLRVVAQENEGASFEELAAFDCVTHCEFNYSRYHPYQLDSEACRYIGQMESLQNLVLGPTLVEGLDHFRQLPLRKLSCGGPDWAQAEFDAIGAIETLEMIQLRTNRFEPANLAAFSNLKNLERAVLTADGDEYGTIKGLSEIASLVKLRHLTLRGILGEDELKTLASMHQLVSIHLQGGGWSQPQIQELRNIENLNYAEFGHMEISVETYDVLVAAGIEVEHYGLTQDELSEEYFVYNDIYFPVDSDKSKITVWCSPDSDTISVHLEVFALPKPRHAWTVSQCPQIEFYGFDFMGDWRELVGVTKSFSADWNDAEHGNFYDGIHLRTNNHEITFGSRNVNKGNKFHVKWSCHIGDSAEDSSLGQIDAHLPLTSVYVSNRSGKTTLEKAKKTVASSFDLKDFEEPVFHGRGDALIVFELKAGVN